MGPIWDRKKELRDWIITVEETEWPRTKAGNAQSSMKKVGKDENWFR